MTVSFGAHVDQEDPLAAAKALGASLSQFFLGNPQGWKTPTVGYEAGPEALKSDAETAGIDLYIHAPYVLNVATTNNRVRIPSRQLLQKQIDLATTIGAKAIIVHGGHVGDEADLGVGFDNWRKCIDGLNITLPLLIENTAGGNGAMARQLERIDQLWLTIASASGVDNVGFCLDTCHAHAGGIELAGIVDKVMAITGRIDLVHANDSRDAFDSGADRHANLGTGFCDPEGLAAVIATAGAPIVLETPGAKEGHTDDIRWIAEHVS
jgi:deoxyribonuclease IV